MTRTQNLNLPQWEAADPIRREDFNAAMATLDAAAENRPYVTGTYTGTGSDMTIALGFRPSFLIISGSNQRTQNYVQWLGAFDLITDGTVFSELVTFGDAGFTLAAPDILYPQLTVADRVYNYIAFR